jgi:hypothetical protein
VQKELKVSDDNQEVGAVDTSAEAVAGQSTEVETGNDVDLSPAQLKAEIAKLKEVQKQVVAERNMLKKKSADYETKLEAEHQAKLVADGKHKEVAESATAKLVALETKIRDREVKNALTSALKTSGVEEEAFNTAMALLDSHKGKVTIEGDEVDQESVKAIITELQAAHPVLFGKKKEPKAATVARATDSGNSEMSDAQRKAFNNIKTDNDLKDYMAKFPVR